MTVYDESNSAVASACDHLRKAVADLKLNSGAKMSIEVDDEHCTVWLEGIQSAIAVFIP